jgi:hypothetical protein
MADADAKPKLKPAEDNPWYLLATLHGKPDRIGERRQAKNRVAWNRYYASQWTDDDRERLKDRVAAEELRPFDDQELVDIRQEFASRAEGRQIDLPDPAHYVKFSSCCFQDEVSFSQYVFGDVYFSDTTFAGWAFFNNATFHRGAYFRNATFAKHTEFISATVAGVAYFESATFTENAVFRSATFTGSAYFESATFTEDASFNSATFTEDASFNSATFTGSADFKSATFIGPAEFKNATFTEDANFNSATFDRDGDFERATFAEYATFSSAAFSKRVIFTNAELKAPTDFAGCRFECYPPEFHGAKLHEGTAWRGVSWPRPPSDRDDAGTVKYAYERLKLEMDRLKKHEDELMFFAKELECRRVAAGRFRGLPIAVYGALCHYGQSYWMPLGWLLAVILVGAVPFWLVQGWDILKSLGVSTANTLAPLGLRKELVDPHLLKDLSGWLRFLSGVQMVMGLELLFLFGLGLRNRFRMK